MAKSTLIFYPIGVLLFHPIEVLPLNLAFEE